MKPLVAQVNVPPGFEPNVKWQIVIQNTIDINAPVEPSDALVWDLDLYHLARNPGIVDHLRANNPNTVIMCYFNAGLAQTSDCDYATRWEDSGFLGNPYEGFEDERWINIKSQAARDLVKRRITLANNLGCDAVDPDNIDGYLQDEEGENKTGWNLSQADYIAFVRELAAHAHSLTTQRGFTMLIGQKNAPEIVGDVADVLDFAVLEVCKTLRDEEDFNFCVDYQEPYIDAGKPVFSIEYPESLGDPNTGACSPSGANETEYENSCEGNVRFSTVLKIQGEIGELNGCTQYCLEAGHGEGVVETATDPALDGIACPPEAE
ncbi:Endo alpha-1,4 polygalactosaminidase [Madurella fahalii]|uniref:alpha-galactosidase n=1 Tax=Madurella fahalii TaxID=1157608 RepID=A0ABQ0G0S4_9PEZI